MHRFLSSLQITGINARASGTMCYEDRLAIISLACRSSVHITYTHLTALFPGLPDFTEARDSDWQWHQLGHMQTICTSLQRDNHASTYHSVFYRPDALAESDDLTVFFKMANQQCQSTEGCTLA